MNFSQGWRLIKMMIKVNNLYIYVLHPWKKENWFLTCNLFVNSSFCLDTSFWVVSSDRCLFKVDTDDNNFCTQWIKSEGILSSSSVGDDIETRFGYIYGKKSWDRQCDDGFACCVWWEQYKTTITRKNMEERKRRKKSKSGYV